MGSGWNGCNVYISHRKNWIKPHSSPWFSAACTAAIVHGGHFFHLYQKDRSSGSDIKFRQASNCCKRALGAAKLAHAGKAEESITSRELPLALVTFGKLLIVVSTNVNLLYLLYSTACI